MVHRAFLVLLLAVGCVDRAVDVARGSGWTAAVTLDRGGGWQRAELVPPDAQLALPVEEGGLLVVFELGDGVLARDGRALTEAEAEELQIRPQLGFEDSTPGGCGRCRVIGSDRLHLGPGDSCPLPFAAPARVLRYSGGEATALDDPNLVEGVQAMFRVLWPGACDTQAPDLEQASSFDRVCPLTPGSSFRPEHLVMAPDGTTLALRSGHVALIPPEGPSVVGELPGFVFGDALAPNEADQPFFVANGAVLQVSRFGTTWARLPAGFADARGLARLEADRVHVLGADERGRPAVARCELRVGRIESCIAERVDCPLPAAPLVDGVPGQGSAVAIDLDGRIFRRFGSRWSCTGRRVASDGAAGFRPTRIAAVEALAGHVWVCADGLQDDVPGAIGLLSAPLGEVLRFEVRDSGPGLACAGFSPVPGRPDQRFALGVLGGGALIGPGAEDVVSCDLGLGCVASLAPRFPSAAFHGVTSVAVDGGGGVVVSDLSGRVHRARAGEARGQVVFGDREAEPFAAAVVAARGPDAWVFSGSGTPRRFRPEPAPSCGQLEPVRPPEGWVLNGGVRMGRWPGTWQDRAQAATWVDGIALVAGATLQEELWLRRVDPASGAVDQVEVPAPALDLIDLGRGRALWVGQDEIFWLDRDDLTLRPVAVAWDDPATVIQEVSPQRSNWRVATARDGVAWVLGTGRIARVLLDAEGVPRAEGYWSFRLTGDRDVWAAAALEPDRVVLMERVYGFDGKARLQVGLLAPECAGQSERFGLGVCVLFADEFAPLSERHPEAPGPARLGPGGLSLSTLLQGLILQGDDATFLPFGWVQDAAVFDGGVLYSGLGQIAAVRWSEP